jgi:hypothetical protein
VENFEKYGFLLGKLCGKFLDQDFVAVSGGRTTGVCFPFVEIGICQKGVWEETMGLRLYLTVAAVVAILYALAFLLIPVQASLLFSDFAEPRAILYLRFCGAAVFAWGLIVWFARGFRDWAAVRGVLIASIAGLAINIILNVSATFQGWLNGNAWGSTVVLALLLLGGVYELVVGAAREG